MKILQTSTVGIGFTMVPIFINNEEQGLQLTFTADVLVTDRKFEWLFMISSNFVTFFKLPLKYIIKGQDIDVLSIMIEFTLDPHNIERY